MKVCIYGVGAIGGFIGTRLALDGGCQVSAVARDATLAALRQHGLRLRRDLAHLGRAGIGEEHQRASVGVHLADHHAAQVGGIAVQRGQAHHPPRMGLVGRTGGQLLPAGLVDGGQIVEAGRGHGGAPVPLSLRAAAPGTGSHHGCWRCP